MHVYCVVYLVRLNGSYVVERFSANFSENCSVPNCNFWKNLLKIFQPLKNLKVLPSTYMQEKVKTKLRESRLLAPSGHTANSSEGKGVNYWDGFRAWFRACLGWKKVLIVELDYWSNNLDSPVLWRRHDTISKEVWLRWSKSLKVSESIMIGISWNLVSSAERQKYSSGPNFSQFRPKARIWGFCVPPWSQQTPWRWSTAWRGSCPGRSFTHSWESPNMQYNYFWKFFEEKVNSQIRVNKI